MSEGIEPTEWQRRVLSVPEEFDLALLGGRGSGKSRAIAFLILRHVETPGARARCLYVRQTHQALEDFALVLRSIFTGVYGAAATFNAASGVWRLPGGGYCELGMLLDDSHYGRYQGRSYSLVAVDEVTQYASPRLVDALRSNIRAERGTATRFIVCGNPGDRGMGWVSRRFVRGIEPWVPFVERDSGKTFVLCPSTYRDNEHLDQATYRRQLEAAAAGDSELQRAWIENDWNALRGSYFGEVIGPAVAFGPWSPETWPGRPPRWAVQHPEFVGQFYRKNPGAMWEIFISHDFGSSAPSVTYVCARSPGTTGPDGRYYSRGSLLLLDELASVDLCDPTRGLGWTVPDLAKQIREMCGRWGVPARGVADPSVFAKTGHSSGSIGSEFAKAGVHFMPGRNERIAGWSRMRTLLANAGKPDVAGLYVSRACRYWWETVPVLPRDPRRREDCDTRGPDHAADACRYAVTHEQRPATVTELLI